MATTFDPALATARDRLRFAVMDTGESGAWLFQDETYDYWVGVHGADSTAAEIVMLRAAIQRISLDPDDAALGGGVSFAWRSRLPALRERLALLSGGSGVLTLSRGVAVEDEFGS